MDIGLLESKNLADLRAIAKLAGVKFVTKYKKDELLAKLKELAEENERENEAKEKELLEREEQISQEELYAAQEKKPKEKKSKIYPSS